MKLINRDEIIMALERLGQLAIAEGESLRDLWEDTYGND